LPRSIQTRTFSPPQDTADSRRVVVATIETFRRACVSTAEPPAPGPHKPSTDLASSVNERTDEYRWTLVLTHDVEGVSGYRNIHLLRHLEREAGFRSSWNLVSPRVTPSP
jgi:hypothetical protein